MPFLSLSTHSVSLVLTWPTPPCPFSPSPRILNDPLNLSEAIIYPYHLEHIVIIYVVSLALTLKTLLKVIKCSVVWIGQFK